MQGDQLSFLGAEDISESQDKVRHSLEATNGHSFAAVEFGLEWQSEFARHQDIFVASNLNLWRDYMLPEMEAALVDQPVGHAARLEFKPGQLVTDYVESECAIAKLNRFNRHYRNLDKLTPQAGRFYPRGVIAGVKGITADDLQPFRLAAIDGDEMTVELNHPLAGKKLMLSARVLEAWSVASEHGGRCNDVPDMIAGKGPGMQARWQGRPTDFFGDDAFARSGGGTDAEFYAKPRMVDHLDRTAMRQVKRLYSRLLPEGGHILDLMSSWKSHLVDGYARVIGLGMNEEELKANSVLTDWLVQDLNEKPALPFGDNTFDGVACTVSVEYLVRPFEVFAEINRVLKHGSPFVVTFSNRWFPPKVIRVWERAHQFERAGMVMEYFLQSGGWKDMHTFSLVGLPRPQDDKYIDHMAFSDPVHAVWGYKA